MVTDRTNQPKEEREVAKKSSIVKEIHGLQERSRAEKVDEIYMLTSRLRSSPNGSDGQLLSHMENGE